MTLLFRSVLLKSKGVGYSGTSIVQHTVCVGITVVAGLQSNCLYYMYIYIALAKDGQIYKYITALYTHQIRSRDIRSIQG